MALAERLGAEIVVADSMQVYRGLPILTNQPTPAQRARVRYHLVGVRGAVAGVVGGRLRRGGARGHRRRPGARRAGRRRGRLGPLPARRARRARLRRPAGPGAAPRARGGLGARPGRGDRRAALARPRHGRAPRPRQPAARDPRARGRALPRPAARRRPSAARSGARRSATRTGWSRSSRERDDLRARVDARVAEMLAAGALDEVRRARAAGPLSRTVRQAIGVRELLAVLDGELRPRGGASPRCARARTPSCAASSPGCASCPTRCASPPAAARPTSVAAALAGAPRRRLRALRAGGDLRGRIALPLNPRRCHA